MRRSAGCVLAFACLLACSDGKVAAKDKVAVRPAPRARVSRTPRALRLPRYRFEDPSYRPHDPDTFERLVAGLNQRLERVAGKLRIGDLSSLEELLDESLVANPWPESRSKLVNHDRAQFVAELVELLGAWRQTTDVIYSIDRMRFGHDEPSVVFLDLAIHGTSASGQLTRFESRSRLRVIGDPATRWTVDRWEWLEGHLDQRPASFALHHHGLGLHPIDGHENRATDDGGGYGAIALGDVDRDGAIDIFAPGDHSSALYVRRQGRFRDEAEERGLQKIRGGTSGVFCDLDGDRQTDLVVTGLGTVDRRGEVHGEPNRAFRNRAGSFVPAFPSLTHRRPSYCAVPFDADLDGDLDLFFCGFGEYDEHGHNARATGERNALYENDGQGNFVDVSLASGITDLSFSRAAVVFDHDLDGDLDLYVVNERREDALLSRDGERGTYENIAHRRTWSASTRADSSLFLDDVDGNGTIELWADLCADMRSECVFGSLEFDDFPANERIPTPALERFDPLWSAIGLDWNLDGRAEVLTIARSDFDQRSEHT